MFEQFSNGDGTFTFSLNDFNRIIKSTNSSKKKGKTNLLKKVNVHNLHILFG